MEINGLIPHIVVNDGEAAIAFYEKAFGAKLESKQIAEDGKRLMHAHLQFGGGTLFLMDDCPEYSGSDGASAPARLGGTSSEVFMKLDNQFWGTRYGQVKDPFDHFWSIGGPVK